MLRDVAIFEANGPRGHLKKQKKKSVFRQGLGEVDVYRLLCLNSFSFR